MQEALPALIDLRLRATPRDPVAVYFAQAYMHVVVRDVQKALDKEGLNTAAQQVQAWVESSVTASCCQQMESMVRTDQVYLKLYDASLSRFSSYAADLELIVCRTSGILNKHIYPGSVCILRPCNMFQLTALAFQVACLSLWCCSPCHHK